MRRLLAACLVSFATLFISSVVVAGGPNGADGEQSVGLTQQQADRIYEVLTLKGSASDDACKSRAIVFLACFGAHLGQAEHKADKAIDSALDDLAGMSADDVVTAAGSGGGGGGGPHDCQLSHATGLIFCRAIYGKNPAEYKNCVDQAMAAYLTCMGKVSCSDTFLPQVDTPCGEDTPSYPPLYMHFPCKRTVWKDFLVPRGIDGLFNIRFRLLWLGNTPWTMQSESIHITFIYRGSGAPVTTDLSLHMLSDTPATGEWVGTAATLIGLPPAFGDWMPRRIRVEVDQDADGNGTLNRYWQLTLDCM